MSVTDPLRLCGWVPDHPDRLPIAASMGPTFAQAAPRLMAAAPAGDILLYRAWLDQNGGKEPPYKAQTIGDCVSHGHGHANDLLQCVEASLNGSDIAYRETDTEFLYGAGRKAGNMLGWQDGCYGSAMVKAMTTVGMVAREMLGPDGEYSGKRAKDWGYHGPPAELEKKAADFKLGNAALVQTWDELLAAIGNGYPVTVCSNQGFTMTRNSEGLCEAQGHWGHCMHLCGIIGDTAVIAQSWGPNVPSGPTVQDMPSFTFRARRNVVERMLAAGDSWALSKSPAFARRDLPAHWRYDSAAVPRLPR
jgi:hypothetical protein